MKLDFEYSVCVDDRENYLIDVGWLKCLAYVGGLDELCLAFGY